MPRVQTFTDYFLAPSVEEMKVTDKSAIVCFVALYVGVGRTRDEPKVVERRRKKACSTGERPWSLRETREASSVRYRGIMKRRNRRRSVCELVEKAE